MRNLSSIVACHAHVTLRDARDACVAPAQGCREGQWNWKRCCIAYELPTDTPLKAFL